MGGISLLFWRLSLNVCWSLVLLLTFNREPPRSRVEDMCVCVCVCVHVQGKGTHWLGFAVPQWKPFHADPQMLTSDRLSLGPLSFLRGKHPPFSVSALCVCVCGGGVGLRVVPISSLKPHPCGAWGPHVQSLPQSEQVEGQCSWLGCERIKETRVSLNTLNTGSQPPLCSARPWPGVWGTPGSSGIMSYLVWVCQNP